MGLEAAAKAAAGELAVRGRLVVGRSLSGCLVAGGSADVSSLDSLTNARSDRKSYCNRFRRAARGEGDARGSPEPITETSNASQHRQHPISAPAFSDDTSLEACFLKSARVPEACLFLENEKASHVTADFYEDHPPKNGKASPPRRRRERPY